MSDIESPDGYINTTYKEGEFTARVINKLSPNIWGAPEYGTHAGTWLTVQLAQDTINRKTFGGPSVAFPIGPGKSIPASDVSYWEFEFPEVDPKVMKMQNTTAIEFAIREDEGDVTARSVTFYWTPDEDDMFPNTHIGGWGLLDDDVVIKQYDTAVIGVNDLNVGITYLAP